MKGWYQSDDAVSLDRQLESHGVSADLLMENVGIGVAQSIQRRFETGHCVICCGPGSNGGDGFVAARHLFLAGWAVEVILSSDEGRSAGSSAAALRLMKRNGLRPIQSSDVDDESLRKLLQNTDLVVDALLGTGASGIPRGEVARLIRAINSSSRPVWSIDLPSGVESGEDCCVIADVTAMAAVAKTVAATGYGAVKSGEAFVLSLGTDVKPFLPAPSLLEMELDDAVALMPRRNEDDHKGSRGGVLIVAGSEQYRGAAWLAVRGALRSGAGLVVLAAPTAVIESGFAMAEAIVEPLDKKSQLGDILERWKHRCSVLLAGPGLGRDAQAEGVCRQIIESQWPGRMLWDGDGLFWLKEIGRGAELGCLLPHEGEAAFLMDCSVQDIKARRIDWAKKISSQWGPVILKGWRSLVALPDKVPVMIPRGNRGLAIPGSGDVLSGICAALLAAGLDSGEALMLGCWLHGSAGEALAKSSGCDGLLASDVADQVPHIMKELIDS